MLSYISNHQPEDGFVTIDLESNLIPLEYLLFSQDTNMCISVADAEFDELYSTIERLMHSY